MHVDASDGQGGLPGVDHATPDRGVGGGGDVGVGVDEQRVVGAGLDNGVRDQAAAGPPDAFSALALSRGLYALAGMMATPQVPQRSAVLGVAEDVLGAGAQVTKKERRPGKVRGSGYLP